MHKIAALVSGMAMAVSLVTIASASELKAQPQSKVHTKHTEQCKYDAPSHNDGSHHQQELNNSKDGRDEQDKPSKGEGQRQHRHRTGRKHYVQHLA